MALRNKLDGLNTNGYTFKKSRLSVIWEEELIWSSFSESFSQDMDDKLNELEMWGYSFMEDSMENKYLCEAEIQSHTNGDQDVEARNAEENCEDQGSEAHDGQDRCVGEPEDVKEETQDGQDRCVGEPEDLKEEPVCGASEIDTPNVKILRSRK